MRYPVAFTGAQTPAARRQHHEVEIIIVIPARINAVGIVAGGLLSFAAFAAPGHAQPVHHRHAEAARLAQACDADTRSRAACRDIGEAIRDPQRLAAAARRKPREARTQRECRTVREAIRENEEAQQRRGARGVMESLQQDTLSLRQRYRELGC